MLIDKINLDEDCSWSSGKAFVSGAEGLRFKSKADQIEHNVANGLPPLQNFFEGVVLPTNAMTQKWGLANLLHASAKYIENDERFDLD